MRSLLPLLPLLALSGCAGSITGTVDDKAVPAFGGSLFISSASEAFDRLFVTVILTTFGDTCRVTTALHEERKQAEEEFQDALAAASGDQQKVEAARAEHAARLGEIDRKHLPAEHWTALVGILPEADEVAGESFSFKVEGALPEATFQLCHQKDFPDHEQVLLEGERDPNLECYSAKDGGLEVSAFEDKETVSASGSAQLVAQLDQGEAVGEIAFELGASHCEDYEALLE